MLDKLEKNELKLLLAFCSVAQQFMFKRMYSPKNLGLSIDDVIDQMDSDKINNAIKQAQRTKINNLKHKRR